MASLVGPGRPHRGERRCPETSRCPIYRGPGAAPSLADLLLKLAEQRLVGRGHPVAVAQGAEVLVAFEETGAGLLPTAQGCLEQAELLKAHDEADLGLHVIRVG